MIKTQTFKVRGLAPLLLHNCRLADPMDPLKREIRKITAKGAKKCTDADLERLGDLEWRAGLYTDEKKRIIIPAENIEAGYLEVAPKVLKGLRETLKGSLSVFENAVLVYDGPKDIDELERDHRFRLRRVMKQDRVRIVRVRPMFSEWSTEFTASYDADEINPIQVQELTEFLGRRGFCDQRPRYGRFEIVGGRTK